MSSSWVCATWIRLRRRGPTSSGSAGVPRSSGALAAVRPDVAHVCTPHDQHAPVVVDCLDAGVAVIVEKPLAATMPQAERILAAADQHPEVKIGLLPEPLQRDHSSDACSARERCRREILGGHGTVLWHRPPAYYTARPWRGRMV